jgi:signal transduction histidine kinase
MSLPEKSTAIRASRHGKAQGKLASALRLQRLLTEISSRFVTRPESETREIIESAQQMICEALCLDRSTLWLFSEDGVEMALSCYWQRPGSPPLRRNYVTRGNLPWADRQIREGKSFRFSSLADLPPEADQDREILIQYGTKSNVTFPLVTHGRVFGALAFATLTAERRWTDEEVASMGLISQIFSHVIGKRRAEERAEQLRDEIQRSTRAAVLGELAAALAHELNQPLTSILANAQAARRFITQGAADTREILVILDDIIRADKRAAEVIRNLREMLGDLPAHHESLCLNELVAEACAHFGNDPANDGIELMFDPGHLPARIKLARGEIQQLLANLILNASHAMSETPLERRRILIQTRCGEGMIHLLVRDHGHGIPPEHLGRIFEPFHTTRSDGLGMGLALCRRIAEAHGGTLKAANHEAGGALFTFSLPFAAGDRDGTMVR